MPQLTRLESRPSIYSWWSDSNPGLQGPTINLHAVAKPLMKVMYHRQALNIIRKNRGSPLSAPELETYSAYFPWDFVAWWTKRAILSDLFVRAKSEVEARAVIDSPVFPYIGEMLKAPDPEARRCSCRLVASLALHKSTAPVTFDPATCEQLVCLLGDNNLRVVRPAIEALREIAKRADGAQAVVDAKAVDYILILLESPGPRVRWACMLLERLAGHDFGARAMLESGVCVRLVSLLSEAYSDLTETVPIFDALSQIAHWPDNSQAIVDANALNGLLALFKNVKEPARRLLKQLAKHESIVPSISQLTAFVCLLKLYNEKMVMVWVIHKLAHILRRLEGARAIVDAKLLDRVLELRILELLYSPIIDIQASTCKLVGRLASHEPTAPAILKLNPSTRLANLLYKPVTHTSALFALRQISKWPEGVASLVKIGELPAQEEEEDV
ncbi:armadillo-type protein [Mycena olivaceomarginata]|nr:armadillo-type protein [Mycena olivaceomarginata]